jgi:hypothetical protein
MKDHYETSADEDYAAEKYELGLEDGTDMKDDGSETSEKVGYLAQRATKTSGWIWERIEREDERIEREDERIEREDWGDGRGDDKAVRLGSPFVPGWSWRIGGVVTR